MWRLRFRRSRVGWALDGRLHPPLEAAALDRPDACAASGRSTTPAATAERIAFRGTPGQADSDADTVFVLDPAAAVEVNVTRFLRVSLGAGYRVVRGVALSGLGNGDAGGFTLGGAVKLGSF